MLELIAKLRETASADKASQWFDVVSLDQIEYVEAVIDLRLPELLRQCYRKVSNGGFGPGYGITGLPGGHESSWGDLLQTVAEARKLDDCEDCWLPLIDWGCAQFLCVDCDDGDLIVTLMDGEFRHEDYNLHMLLERWCAGEVPDLESGMFHSVQHGSR